MAALLIILIVTEVRMLQMANQKIIIKSGPCDFQVFQQEEIKVVIHLLVHSLLRCIMKLNECNR